MPSNTDVLDPEASWQLLRSSSVGRLALTVREHPFVFPVNYLVDGDVVVFQTGEGTKLDHIFSSRSIVLEADHIDLSAGEAWSVVVVGHALPIGDADRVADLEQRLPRTWSEADPMYLIEIRPDEITGRVHRRSVST